MARNVWLKLPAAGRSGTGNFRLGRVQSSPATGGGQSQDLNHRSLGQALSLGATDLGGPTVVRRGAQVAPLCFRKNRHFLDERVNLLSTVRSGRGEWASRRRGGRQKGYLRGLPGNSQGDPNNRWRHLRDLILRSDAQHRISKDGPARSLVGAPWSVLRDAALRAPPQDEGGL